MDIGVPTKMEPEMQPVDEIDSHGGISDVNMQQKQPEEKVRFFFHALKNEFEKKQKDAIRINSMPEPQMDKRRPVWIDIFLISGAFVMGYFTGKLLYKNDSNIKSKKDQIVLEAIPEEEE